MGMNFFLIEREELMSGTDELGIENTIVFERKYHICKLSHGIVPIFDSSHGHFETFDEILGDEPLGHIEDEGGIIYAPEEFEEIVRAWALENKRINKELVTYQDLEGFHWCRTSFI